MSLSCTDLGVVIGAEAILSSVNLSIAPGQVTAVVGPAS